MRKILITGAGGNIGRKLWRHFEARGDEVHGLDRDNSSDPAIQLADLSQWDELWVARFQDVDCVFHLAGNPRPTASWASIQALNIDLTLNVYEAAARQGARRLVFASSNWVLAGHRFADGPHSRPSASPTRSTRTASRSWSASAWASPTASAGGSP